MRRPGGQASYFTEDLGGSVTLDMVYVPGGTFYMGSSDADAERFKKDVKRYCESCPVDEWARWETPQHQVALQEYYMGKYEVTQAQWQRRM